MVLIATPVFVARNDATDVGIDDGLVRPEREDGHRTGGVVAHAGEGEKRIHLARDLAPVVFDDGYRTGVKPQRAAGVAEVRPGSHGVGRRSSCKCGRSGPPCKPFIKSGDDAGDGRLLQHELAHQRAPGGEPGSAPRQVTTVTVEPRNHLALHASEPN